MFTSKITMANTSLVMDSRVQLTVNNSEESRITIRNVCDLEKELDFMEKVSLVYLLYDDVEIALQHLFQLQNGAVLDVIVEWATHTIKIGGNWQDKLLESLAIIQNFYVIHKLGFNIDEVCIRFLPTNSDSSLFIELYKKKLYCIYDEMTNDQMKTFLKHIQNDFNHKKLIFKDFPVPYMEMFLLYWTSIKYISPTDLTNLSKAFKIMEMYETADSITKPSLVKYPESNYNNKINNGKLYSSIASTSIPLSSSQSNSYKNQNYHIDPSCPGICLIINQESFYREPDPELEHLLPPDQITLGCRDGTNIDRDSLKATFGMLGYDIVIRENLTHAEILEAVVDTVNAIRKHSSLIVCVLSHGLEGKVFGVNSISVNISNIRDIICSNNTHNLRCKPKIMILQCCQGVECQTVSDDEDDEPEINYQVDSSQIKSPAVKQSSMQHSNECNIEMDGPSRPKAADVLVFWATVPGFGAVRDKFNGSWFIQSLCKHIQENANKMHFEDICTLVKQEVIDKRWKRDKMSGAMVPNKESTLSQFFFLPPFVNR